MDLIELGAFLKSRRDRIPPADVGLPAGPRRRVPGLRRDEVAQLAGASVEYYTEIERGSGAQPSEQMLAALARALRLTLDERNHIYHLGGRALPQPGGSAAHVHPGMLDLLGRLTTTPARVITDLHVTLVQNRLAAALLGPEPETTGIRASFIHRWFTDRAARTRYPVEDHDTQSRLFVADLRAAIARRGPHDQEATTLVEQLLRQSPEFTALWAQRDVAVRRNDRKRIVHPVLGVIDVDCLHLFSEDGRQRLLWFAPAIGTESVEKLELLSVLGTQDLAPKPLTKPPLGGMDSRGHPGAHGTAAGRGVRDLRLTNRRAGRCAAGAGPAADPGMLDDRLSRLTRPGTGIVVIYTPRATIRPPRPARLGVPGQARLDARCVEHHVAGAVHPAERSRSAAARWCSCRVSPSC